jgi:hypothetical protein
MYQKPRTRINSQRELTHPLDLPEKRFSSRTATFLPNFSATISGVLFSPKKTQAQKGRGTERGNGSPGRDA